MADLVALEMPGGPAWVAAVQACWDAGDAVAPLPTGLADAARRELLDAIAPTHAIGIDGVKREVSSPGSPALDGDAVVLATSGTTGRPKGVVLTHDALERAAEATFDRLGCSAHDHWLACLPLHHVGGFSVVSRALRRGLGLTVHPGFDAAAATRAAAAGATHTSLVPTALARLDPHLFRLVLVGGSVAPRRRADNVVLTYGMTETGGGVVYDGRPLDGVEISVDGAGVISLRTPTMARSYRDGSAVADEEGWHRSGDLGAVDPATGVLTVHGRHDDVINTGGEKVWPARVEAELLRHPAVEAVAVVGRPDPEWGEAVTAVVVGRSGADPPDLEALRGLCKEALPAAWAPTRIEVVAALPTTALGKVRRNAI